MNSIELSLDTSGLEIGIKGDARPILTGNLLIADTCLLFPAIIPRDKRNIKSLQKYLERLYPFNGGYNKLVIRKENEKKCRKCINIVNAIEDGKFSRLVSHIGITDEVWKELWGLSEQAPNYYTLENYMRDLISHSYSIEFNGYSIGDYHSSNPINLFRKKYNDISKLFSSDGDFSIAIASYALGCNLATEDHRDFNSNTIRSFSKIYSKEWGLNRPFRKHDSESLCMVLDKF